MNTEKLVSFDDDLVKRMQEHTMCHKLKKMEEEGTVIELSDDEERLLKAYRGFIRRSKPGAVFSWETPDDKSIVLPSDDPIFVLDPREVSKV